LEKPIRLFVMVRGDEIIVTSETGFRAAYCKRPNKPLLKLKRLTGTEDHELLAQSGRKHQGARAGVDRVRGVHLSPTPASVVGKVGHSPMESGRPRTARP
jgi:hypothetical protein